MVDSDYRVRLFCFVLREFHQVSLDKAIDFTIHHATHIACLESCAVVFDASVVKHIASDLASPFNFLFARLDFSLCRLTFCRARS